MQKYISKFHYLTQNLQNKTHLDQVQDACEAGANWIQYRCLNKNNEELIYEINQLALICDDWGTTLILTEHYNLVHQVDAQGIHLEDPYADFKLIRREIGDEKTLGASANSFQDIQRIAASGVVDYIGCGPFSTTLTKPNNHPLIGINGYQIIAEQMDKAGIKIPVLAVGGIGLDDVDALVKTGIYGIAACSAINTAENPKAALKSFYKKTH